MPVRFSDSLDQLRQPVARPGARNQQALAINADIYRIAFVDLDLPGDRRWNPQGQAIAPFLNRRIHMYLHR